MNEQTSDVAATQCLTELEPVIADKEPVVLHVHRELRRAILRGRIPTGTRLVETQISAGMAVSRTPVREAISKLESEGLVDRQNSGGVIVASFGQKLSEVMILRQAVEGAAARLACMNASDAALAELLRKTRAAMRDTADSTENRSVLDREFHMGIARASDSRRICLLIEELYEYSFAAIDIKPTAEETLSLRLQHLEVASAIAQRDGSAAESLIRQHFEDVRAIAERHVRERETTEKENRNE